jgi:hypothetical protein
MAKRTLDYTEKNYNLRKEADEIILQLWNEIESSYSTYPEEERKKFCEEYGIVYFYRMGELEKAEADKAATEVERESTDNAAAAEPPLNSWS